ncbi:MAG: hypothetical protein GXC72_06140 [Chitinophagaceae bacterium]|nr:hypothetical protein [Chitinophagaceae bacterium]
MKPLFGGLLICLLYCSCKSMSFTQKTLPAAIPIQDYRKSIVIVDAGEVLTPGLAITKKRNEVVNDVKRVYLSRLSDVLKTDLQLAVFQDTVLSADQKKSLLEGDTAIIRRLQQRDHAGLILVMQEYDGGFSQDDVTRTKNNDGSVSKLAHYSVFFNTELTVLQQDRVYHKRVTASRPHSERSVLSGLLARGPGYESNRKDIVAMAEQNARNVSGLFRDRIGMMNQRGEFIENASRRP